MNFLDALNTPAGEIEKPRNLPMGTYLWGVSKAHKESQVGKGEWNVIEIPVVPKAVDADSNDVDEDELAAYGALSQGTNSIRFMFSTDPTKAAEFERTLYQLKKFLLDVLRVDGDESSTIKELLAKSIGCEFKAQAVHRPDPERDTVFIDVKNYMAV